MTMTNVPASPPNPPNPPNPANAASPAQSGRVLLKELKEKFATFRDCKPLAIGIDKQLLALIPGLDRKLLRIALGIHTNSLPYLKAIEKATTRFDLEGNAADEVSDAHRAHAAETLKERFKKNADLRKAQRDAENALRKAADAQRKEEEAAQQRADKLNQLTAKFSRR